MRMNYKNQLIVSVIVIILANVLSTIFKHWIYRSAGFILCGLLFLLHPVLPNGVEKTKKTLLWVRIAGVVLVLIGVFTRAYTY